MTAPAARKPPTRRIAPAAFLIRRARLDEAEAVAHIEADADRRFLGRPGFTMPAGITYPRLGRFHASVSDGRVFVAVDAADDPVGFAEMDWLGPEPYLGELSVAMAHQGRGIGGDLLERACDWALDQGGAGLLLSTRRDIPWNAPWYRRRGFAEIPAADYGLPHIAARRSHEATYGDVAMRTMMRRPLAARP